MTELDHTVLAVVVRDGPISAYGIRMVFAGSSTPTWSSSSGSVYPCVRRLLAAGLILTSPPQGARGMQELSASTSGRHAVEAWMCSVDAQLAAATPDPVRTRAFFLALLDENLRERFIDAAIESTVAAMHELEDSLEEERATRQSKLEILAGLGALYELRARKEWLMMLRRAPLGEPR